MTATTHTSSSATRSAASAANASAPNASDGYLLGSSDHERQRLLEQAQMFERDLGWLIGELGDLDIESAVDVGCGPRGILPALADIVGPSGSVIGIDADATMIAQAAEECASLGLSNVTCRTGEATELELTDSSVDLAHVRLVLVNVATPSAVISELVRVTRPGGLVIAQEYDLISWECEPCHPSFAALREAMITLWASRGFDGHIGRRLPRLFSEAGLVEVNASAHVGIDDRHFWNQRLLSDFARRFAPQLVGLGIVSDRELATHLDALADHLDRPDTIVIRPMLVQAWGTVPRIRDDAAR
jgi:SAM-dependent methyltransferase